MNKAVQFREQVEAATSPLIAELREKLANIPTVALLNHYQLKHHLSQFKKDEFPDGFWAKWRYLWALRLSIPFSEAGGPAENEQGFAEIDELIERIFDLYSFGAVYEPGRKLGSEEEFLSRLGLGLNVREIDALCFPEQVKNWALVRFKPFNDSYFLPVFGLRFEEIYEWTDKLIALMEERLNRWVSDLASIFKDLRAIQKDFVAGILSAEESRSQVKQLKIGERLEKNGRESDDLHIFSEIEIQQDLSRASYDALIKLFGIKLEDIGSDFVFPHHGNPLDWKTFVVLPNETLYFLDPASAHRVLARTFERGLSGSRRTERTLPGESQPCYGKSRRGECEQGFSWS